MSIEEVDLVSMKVLIIDEISMLHKKQLDMVDQVLCFFKEDDRAFGGIQVVFCGDFFQLPPIGRSDERVSAMVYIQQGALSAFAFAGCSSDTTTGSNQAALTPSCIDDAGTLDPEEWLCPNSFSVECEDGVGDPDTVYIEPAEELAETACDQIALRINDEGPFAVGTHPVVITAEASDDGQEPTIVECEAELTVEDTQPPEANEDVAELWPPNHKFHTVFGYDCVTVEPLDVPEADGQHYGLFKNAKAAKRWLQTLCDEHDLCRKKLGLERGLGSCFGYQIKRCQGACLAKQSFVAWNLSLREALGSNRLGDWPFKGPVVLSERRGQRLDLHVVDRWCHLGTVHHRHDIADVATNELLFDLDIYRILKRFLDKSAHRIEVTEI